MSKQKTTATTFDTVYKKALSGQLVDKYAEDVALKMLGYARGLGSEKDKETKTKPPTKSQLEQWATENQAIGEAVSASRHEAGLYKRPHYFHSCQELRVTERTKTPKPNLNQPRSRWRLHNGKPLATPSLTIWSSLTKPVATTYKLEL